MKIFTSLKSITIIAISTLFLVSCSHERYGNLQRGTAKAKDIAKVEKTKPSTASNTEESNLQNSDLEKSADQNVFTGLNETQKVETVLNNNSTDKASPRKFSQSAKHSWAPLAKISAPFASLKAFNKAKKGNSGFPYILAILLCIIPFAGVIMVGLATDWDITKVIISLLLYFLFYIPGLIYSLIVVINNKGSFD